MLIKSAKNSLKLNARLSQKKSIKHKKKIIKFVIMHKQLEQTMNSWLKDLMTKIKMQATKLKKFMEIWTNWSYSLNYEIYEFNLYLIFYHDF